MTNEQLHANRNCPLGGGCKDCPCDGDCKYRRRDEPTIIKTFSNCSIVQDEPGSYRVMTKNNICILHVGSITGAFKYAEWFAAKDNEPTMAQQMMFAERSERLERGE